MSKDQYEVLESIGSGTFGTVHKVKRKTDSKLLCWKEINFGAMSEKEKAQLVAEVNIIKELKSPFIIKYYDRIIDKTNTRLYIVMEYCSGGDLGKLIAKHRRDKAYMDENFIWKIAAQCLLAIKECHRRVDENGISRPILHRDIKPANILLDTTQQIIKTGDFGLAKELSNHTRIAQTNVGTPLYMAPEIINERGYDEKTDIWALGCLIYEMASLRPPFDAANAVALAIKINAGKFNRIPTKYSDGLFELIKSMLQLDPKRRPRIEEILEMQNPHLQNAAAKARELVQQHQFDITYASRVNQLIQRENTVKAKEKELQEKEILLNQREQKLQQLAIQLENDQKRLQQQYHCQSQDMVIDDAPSAKIPLKTQVGVKPPAAMPKPSSAGFVIHTDKPVFNLQQPSIPSRVHQLIKEKPMIQSSESLDKENQSLAPPPAPMKPQQLFERRGLRERAPDSNVMDIIGSPTKKQRFEKYTAPLGNRYINTVNIESAIPPPPPHNNLQFR